MGLDTSGCFCVSMFCVHSIQCSTCALGLYSNVSLTEVDMTLHDMEFMLTEWPGGWDGCQAAVSREPAALGHTRCAHIHNVMSWVSVRMSPYPFMRSCRRATTQHRTDRAESRRELTPKERVGRLTFRFFVTYKNTYNSNRTSLMDLHSWQYTYIHTYIHITRAWSSW